MYRFYDKDTNGKWREHQFTKDEPGCMLIALLILGVILPIILFICSA